ncbi:Mov34/MPN/PAD-1 family protein (plasmid) [Crinalium epipsammum PCC 9333]|uniref:Mov34/MPN/PAD-1 family protein n=1 Tax=Crinalium epipsammum PCC 9333 TaxID=1173022 RepID=K9W796_9CYAN|nr:Mov34/MPN/PAD-1 family protein [Crinalium epipsammum]AFZ15617.1 Mov34/MPN/PAD-1 family protein [Crinalium epipsammum PCC 9333]
MPKLQWRDSEDVYKPISRSLKEFLQENHNRIRHQNHRGIEALYKQLSNNRMSVFVEREAEDRLIEHLRIDPNNETGGVLVGQAYLCPDTKNHYTEIVGSIAAPYTVGNRVHFHFTPECWQAILSDQKEYFPRTTVVGWYHSHPGHGIFLSGTDLNTQRLCFKQIWQIAVVYDPLRQEIGYFYDADGRRVEAIYLQEMSEAAQSQPEQQQLNWRQPELQLSTVPTPSSLALHNTPEEGEEPLQDIPQQIARQTKTRGQNPKFILVLPIIVVLFLLVLFINSNLSQPGFKLRPSQSQPTKPQSVDIQPAEPRPTEPHSAESKRPKLERP